MEDGISDVYFSSHKVDKKQSVEEVVSTLDPILKEHLIFLHAWTPCDVTSVIYRHGKTYLISKISFSWELQNYAELISDWWANIDEVVHAGQKTFVLMYGVKQDESLNSFRLVCFCLISNYLQYKTFIFFFYFATFFGTSFFNSAIFSRAVNHIPINLLFSEIQIAGGTFYYIKQRFRD